MTGGYLADDAVDCTSPSTAEVGEHAHRLAIPGAIHPVHGERRLALGATWTWDAERHGWQRTA